MVRVVRGESMRITVTIAPYVQGPPTPEELKLARRVSRRQGLFAPDLLQAALTRAFVMLRPDILWKNPVMFVVEVGTALSVVYTVVKIIDPTSTRATVGYLIQLDVWLFLTVLFANFAEALAEARGKAQADTLRKTRRETPAYRRRPDGSIEETVSTDLKAGDLVVVETGQMIPGDGEIIEGIASVDESAITGESAPVVRESGGDRSAVTGGTRVLSDQIVVRITSKPGETFLDRMIALVEGASRQQTPNALALSILLAGLTLVFLTATATPRPSALYAQRHAPTPVLIA